MLKNHWLLVLDDLHNFGPSYSKTLLAWHAKNWPKLEKEFGPMVDGIFKKSNVDLLFYFCLPRCLNQYVQTKN